MHPIAIYISIIYTSIIVPIYNLLELLLLLVSNISIELIEFYLLKKVINVI